MNFVFKIFGAPYGFELYRGAENEQNYFQTFDNGSKENTKLVIHRMASGQVSYSYLRYKLRTSGGRDNSFFGMSVVFNREYCADIEGLYDLFEAVYETIPKNRILFEEIKGEANVQAKYLIHSFTDAPNEIARIENIVCRNVEKVFADDVRPLDGSFQQGNPNLIRKLNDKKDNAAFVNALRRYSWVYISSNYGDEEGLSPEAVAGLDERIEFLQKNITAVSINALKDSNVRKDIEFLWKQIQSDKALIQPFLQIQSELQERNKKLNECEAQLFKLNEAVLQVNTGGGKTETTDKITTGGIIKGQPTDKPKNKTGRSGADEDETLPSDSFFGKYLPYFIVAAVFAAIVVVSIFVFRQPDDNKGKGGNIAQLTPAPSEEDKIAIMIKEGNTFLQNNDFDNAINKFEQANSQVNVERAKEIAIQFYKDKAVEAEKAADAKNTTNGKIKKLNDAINYLKEAEKYGENVDNYIANYQKKINAAKRTTTSKGKSEKASKDNNKTDKKTDDKGKGTGDNATGAANSEQQYIIEFDHKIKRKYSVGASFHATAKIKKTKANCTDGEWKQEGGLIIENENPTKVSIAQKPPNGKATLSYWVNGKQVAAQSIDIVK